LHVHAIRCLCYVFHAQPSRDTKEEEHNTGTFSGSHTVKIVCAIKALTSLFALSEKTIRRVTMRDVIRGTKEEI
jgi:hypothetical protein